jgi:RimJ/RimL family protein N-acetyltransferase
MRIVMRESPHLLLEPDEFSYTVEQEAEILRTYRDHEDKLWIVPVVEGQLVGALNFSAGGRKRLKHFGSFGVSLLPSMVGQGIGRRMMRAMIDWAEAHPRLEMIRLQVHARNTGALRLYQALGFVEEGREKRGVKFVDGTYDDVISMALELRKGINR